MAPPSRCLSPAPRPPCPTFRPREHLFSSDTAVLTPLPILPKHPEEGEADLDQKMPLSDLHLARCLVSQRPILISFGPEHLSQLFCNPEAPSLGTVIGHIPPATYHSLHPSIISLVGGLGDVPVLEVTQRNQLQAFPSTGSSVRAILSTWHIM